MAEEYDTNWKHPDLMRKLKGDLTYTEILPTITNHRDQTCKPAKALTPSSCKADPTKFAYHMLGITPYTYQYMLFEKVRLGRKRIALTSSRQIGKSLAVAILALWAAWGNFMPSSVHQNTKVLIISRSDGQAKKLLNEIKKLITLADRKFAIRTSKRCMNVISSCLADDQPQTASQISFRNGSFIKSLPPTDASRGESVDLLIEDEGGFIEDTLHYDVLEPMTNKTDGTIIITGTPNGYNGIIYKAMDPYNENDNNPYERLWIPWWYIEDESQKARIEEKKEQWIGEGKARSFQQEYEAKFTISENNLFEDTRKIDDAIDQTLAEVYEEKKQPCSLGLDYGWKRSKTVITISRKNPDNSISIIYQYAYPNDGTDVDVYKDIQSLKNRYNLKYYVVDNCSMGYITNQKLQNAGLPVMLFNFRSDQTAGERNRGYYMLKQGILSGKIKMPQIPLLVKELKTILEIKKQIYTSIRAPAGGSDDAVDSATMSCYPFLLEDQEDEEPLAGTIQNTFRDKPITTATDRKDREWETLKGPAKDNQFA